MYTLISLSTTNSWNGICLLVLVVLGLVLVELVVVDSPVLFPESLILYLHLLTWCVYSIYPFMLLLSYKFRTTIRRNPWYKLN